MFTLTAIFAVLFGLAFGSFLNVCISRLPLGTSVVSPGSRCPRCLAPIRVWDNVPLVSYAVLRGRCRMCGVRIPLRYPAVEAVTAGLFLLCFLSFGLSGKGVGAAILCFLLVALAAMDAETFLLPDAFTLPGIVLGILYSVAVSRGDEAAAAPLLVGHAQISAGIMSAITALTAAAFILVIRWTYWLVRRQEGMGLGDAKLMAMIGAWFGPSETFVVFFLAVIGGAIYGLAVILVARVRRRHTEDRQQPMPTKVPFGAFLCVAGLFALFWGMSALRWYFGLFG